MNVYKTLYHWETRNKNKTAGLVRKKQKPYRFTKKTLEDICDDSEWTQDDLYASLYAL